MQNNPKAAAPLQRLYHLNLSFLRNRPLRRILQLAGYDLRYGLPQKGDGIAVWGASPTAWRGEHLAQRKGLPLYRIEDAFLRSLRPGRMGDAPLGIMIDDLGLHFDAKRPSQLERILADHPLDAPELLARAEVAMARLASRHLSKYNLHDPQIAAPEAGYVLIIDQTLGDAALQGAGAELMVQMIAAARQAHPQARLLVKTHPESAAGLRQGLWQPEMGGQALSAPLSPYVALSGAKAVYTISSQLGFEAILAGHRPHVWGSPFYAGWGLSEDRQSFDRRNRKLSAAQLFAAAMILAPLWYDPCRDRLCSLEEVIDQLEAEVKAYRQDRKGHIASAMRLWKRGRMQEFFGQHQALRFVDDPAKGAQIAQATGKSHLVWAAKADRGLKALRVEDGFLRSRGLGADLIAPLSLVIDESGIYYDPSRPSDLERLILSPLPAGGEARALALIDKLRQSGVTKYNLTGALPALPQGHRILVVGQVEDDASILQGAGEVKTNLALLRAARAAHPRAILLYKPHPDVVAGLRQGTLPEADQIADMVVDQAPMNALLDQVQDLWTITSLSGFEALLRGVKVTCLGAPFYAGWGLTEDHMAIDRRGVSRSLAHLTHAALIDYPRYWDPLSRRPCPAEVALARLATGHLPRPSRANRLLAKLQGAFAAQAHLWR